ncbi:hypothetical protein JXA47_07165 [Candidatus Sumerlaeota bacterium]|nr:hypothetical protein [Candidatus Sumerlaeota bacterium]
MASEFEFRFHLVSGAIHRFAQSDSEIAQQILAHVPPEKIFQTPQITVWNEHSINHFRSDQVLRLDLITDEVPKLWTMPAGFESFHVITEEKFLTHIERGVRGSTALNPDETFVGFGELQFINGQSLHLEARGEVSALSYRLHNVTRILFFPSIFAHLPAGGVTLINMANVAGLRALPSPPEAPHDAWVGRRLPN